MISELFIDKCITMCCSIPPTFLKSKEFLTLTRSFLKWYVKSNKFDYTVENMFDERNSTDTKLKLEFLLFLTKYRIENGDKYDVNDFIETIKTGKFKDLVDVVKTHVKEISTEDVDQFLNKTLIPKNTFGDIIEDVNKFKSMLKVIENDEYEDYVSLAEEWKTLILKQYKNIVKIKKMSEISESISLDVNNDNFDFVMDRLKRTINVKNIVQSGFSDIDDCLPYKGFEKRRIYIFAGESGVGKSIMLMNILTNDIKKLVKLEQNAIIDENENKNSKPKAHLFITAENLIDESLVRFYCALTGNAHFDTIQRLREDPTFNLQADIVAYTKQAGINVLFYYVPSMVASLLDLEAIIDTYQESYELQSIMVDYLDLIRSGSGTDTRYLELGEVATGLKRFATMYDVPVLTVTQLNRSGYNNANPALTSVSGSMEKVNDADFIAFIQRSEKEIDIQNINGMRYEGKVVRVSILKNRNGEEGHKFKLFLTNKINDVKKFNYTFIPMVKVEKEYITDEDLDEDPYSHLV